MTRQELNQNIAQKKKSHVQMMSEHGFDTATKLEKVA